MKRLICIVFVLAMFVLGGCSESGTATPDISQKINYSYLNTDTGKLGGKTIAERYIKLMPNPTIEDNFTKAGLAQTAIAAALNLKEELPESDIIRIFIVPEKQFIGAGALAKAFYNPDGEGADGSKSPVWDVAAIDAEINREDWAAMQKKGIFGRFIGMSDYKVQ